MKPIFILLFFAVLFSCDKKTNNTETVAKHVKLEKGNLKLPNYEALLDLNMILETPKPGEWLYSHYEEGQSYSDYLKLNPVAPFEDMKTIYIQPIGKFTDWEQKVINWNTEYIELFFNLKTIQLPPISEKSIPKNKQRIHYGNEQLDASYIINTMLPKKTPKNGIVIMGLTAKDLYPKPSWNFVFGLASYTKRTGVSSIARYSEEELNESNYTKCLMRLMKTASHEISHMFTIKHCTYAICLMNGSNNLDESDSRPNALCSECLSKLSWNLNFDNVNRLNKLIAFMETHRLNEDASVLKKQRDVMLLKP